jgi:cell division protein FtsN
MKGVAIGLILGAGIAAGAYYFTMHKSTTEPIEATNQASQTKQAYSDEGELHTEQKKQDPFAKLPRHASATVAQTTTPEDLSPPGKRPEQIKRRFDFYEMLPDNQNARPRTAPDSATSNPLKNEREAAIAQHEQNAREQLNAPVFVETKKPLASAVARAIPPKRTVFADEHADIAPVVVKKMPPVVAKEVAPIVVKKVLPATESQRVFSALGETKKPAVIENKPVTAKKFYLQVGAYSSQGEAKQLSSKLSMMGLDADIQSTQVAEKTKHRVRVGPFNSPEELQKVRAELSLNGVDSVLSRNQ